MTPPETAQPERVLRTILADKPRVTRFPIKWDDILDETLKKPEDEELDKDADLRGPDAGHHGPPGPEGDDGEEESDSEEDSGDDEFTSQLGPEEQDRMSMMIDEDGDHAMFEADENQGGDPNTIVFPVLPSAGMKQPSPLGHFEANTTTSNNFMMQ